MLVSDFLIFDFGPILDLEKDILGPKNGFFENFYKNFAIYLGPGTCVI